MWKTLWGRGPLVTIKGNTTWQTLWHQCYNSSQITISTTQGDLLIPFRKSTFGQLSFSVKAIQNWNSLLTTIPPLLYICLTNTAAHIDLTDVLRIWYDMIIVSAASLNVMSSMCFIVSWILFVLYCFIAWIVVTPLQSVSACLFVWIVCYMFSMSVPSWEVLL